MPHDKKGTLLAVGDEVTITGRVTQIQPGDEYCNVTVELPPMPPYTVPYTLTINTRQTEKIFNGPQNTIPITTVGEDEVIEEIGPDDDSEN